MPFYFEPTIPSALERSASLIQSENEAAARMVYTPQEKELANKPPILAFSGISKKTKSVLEGMARRLGSNCVDDAQFGATHLIVASSGETKLVKKRTAAYLFSLATGLWIVDESWVRDSESEGAKRDEAAYEVLGDSNFGRHFDVVK